MLSLSYVQSLGALLLLAGVAMLGAPGEALSAQPAGSERAAPGRGGPIAGVVRARDGQPVAMARVQLVELQRQVLTDSAGRFRFGGVPVGTYRLSVTRIGFTPRLATVRAGDADVPLVLDDGRVELSAVQVSASPTATTPMRAPQAMATLGGEPLREAQGRSVGETLEPLAGLRSISMTTGIGKPVIRGLSSQRVVTLDNGQRVESQQWGTDHAPTMETRDAERIEVIKGPASVLYGSDAIGGVVNVVARALPDATGRTPFVQGGVATLYDSNLRGPEATVSLEGGVGGLGWRASATGRAMGDMRTPDGPLANTQNRTGNLLLAAGWRGSWGSVATRVSRRDERIEIYDDPVEAPGYSGFQRIVSERAKVEVRVPMRTGRLELDVAAEGNDRREFDDVAADLHALGLTARTVTATAHWHDAPRRAIGADWQGMLGVAGMTQRFAKSGLETLVPDAGAGNVGVYGYQQGTWDRLALSVGARWDVRTITAEDDDVLGLTRTTRSWSTWTGNLGATYTLREDVALVATIARGFRSPWYNELFANGFHEGTRAFERGNPALELETSRNLDLGVRVRRRVLTLDAGVFSNVIDNYIYLRPFGTGGRLFDSLAVVQGDAWLRGGELAFTVQPVRWLTLDAGGDITLGDNRTTAVPLTFVAPPRLTWGVRAGDGVLAPLQRLLGGSAVPYVRVSGEAHATQTRLDPSDIAPAGFTLWHASAGVSLATGRGPVQVDLVARNLFDVRYRPFLSRYKEFADAPGRAVQLRVSVGMP